MLTSRCEDVHTYIRPLRHTPGVNLLAELGLVVVDIVKLDHKVRLRLQLVPCALVDYGGPEGIVGLLFAVQTLGGVEVTVILVDDKNGPRPIAGQHGRQSSCSCFPFHHGAFSCTRRLLRKLQENIEWARMKFKPSKSRSLSVVKGKLSDQRFYIGEEPIPTVAEKPIKSLGRWYDATLKDTVQVEQLRQDTISGLQSIEKTMLPGRLKLWCLQFGLLPRLMWPLTIYEVPISKVDKLERLVSSFARKWLGVPRCLSNIALYGKGILELPLSSLTEEYKSTKVRLQMMLTESRDPCVAKTAPTLSTGRKWTPSCSYTPGKVSP
ncbi:hypothetical protein N1851_004106 [Merluccius polli]|uniref:Uncharacterized protein n=1 Tax=Merluccius polli TaxID=89951 RepID=A0AA47P9X4_MERPO|nr:hypothetical protein N1851_004106 [Merluccius polli]